MSLNRPILLSTMISLTLMLAPHVCIAGIGSGISASTLVDTADPILNLDPLPEHLLIHAGSSLDFHWTSEDLNPGIGEDDFTAVVLIDQQPTDAITWYPEISEFTWTWTSPEVQTASCQLEVTVKDLLGNTTVAVSDYFTVLFSVTAVEELPSVVHFPTPYPNPFNPACELAFSLPTGENVELDVFDTRGRKIKNLIQGPMPAGTTNVRWNGTDQHGRPQSGGVYFFVLKTTGPEGAVKMVRKATLIP